MSNSSPTSTVLHRVALVSLILLVTLCVTWEWLLAPVRPGGSWMVLKSLPLLLPFIASTGGIAKRDPYTMQWTSMLVLLYMAEGAVRAMTDQGVSRVLACVEIGLSGVLFVSLLLYLRPLKRQAKQAAQLREKTHDAR